MSFAALASAPRAATAWAALPVSLRDYLVKQGLESALVFRSCMDGSKEEAEELSLASNGSVQDVPLFFFNYGLSRRVALKVTGAASRIHQSRT